MIQQPWEINHHQKQGRHALIIFEGARVGGGGSWCDTHQPQKHLFYLFIFLFIWNIPKPITYIIKYFDSHLYRLLVDLLRAMVKVIM